MPSEQFAQLVELIRASATGAEALATYEESRARLDGLGGLFPVPDDVEVRPVEINGVPCERFVPAVAADGGLILYHHGGSYTAGSLVSHRALTARLAQACGSELLAVDYRLAPEHP